MTWRAFRIGRYRVNALLAAGAAIVAMVAGEGLLAPAIAPHDPLKIYSGQRLRPASERFWFGTDELGRDVASRVAYGMRVTLVVALASTAFALLVGGALGVTAGYAGGAADRTLAKLVDTLFSIPALILAIVLAGAIGPSLPNAILAIGIVYVPRFARITRAAALSIKPEEFVEAALALGTSHMGIVWRHVLPNMTAPVLVQTTFSISTAIVTEATLSFLGLGVQPPTPSLGNMLQTGRLYMELSPLVALAPGLAITATILGFNMLGDGLRDMFDPRLREA